MRYALCAFPLVGVVCALAFGVWGWAAAALDLPVLLRAAGFCLLPVWLTGGIHLDGYADTCDALASYGDRGQASGHPQGPPLRGLCGDPAVQLVCGRPGPVRRPAPDHRGGGLYAAGLCAGAGPFGLGGGRPAPGQTHRPGPTPLPRRRPGAGARLVLTGEILLTLMVLVPLGGRVGLGHAGGGPGGPVAVCRGGPPGFWRDHRGTWPDGFLQRCELWMLGALVAAQLLERYLA